MFFWFGRVRKTDAPTQINYVLIFNRSTNPSHVTKNKYPQLLATIRLVFPNPNFDQQEDMFFKLLFSLKPAVLEGMYKYYMKE